MARILVVDDDERMLSLLCQYLNAFSFEVEAAHSPVQARHCLTHSKYDAVISDFTMPGESGLDLLSHVSCRFPGLPFILMTGDPSSRLRQKAIKMGSRGYLEKPFELNELVRTLRTVLGPRQMDPK